MFKILKEIWNSKDIRNKILFTFGILIVYRLISQVTVPNVNFEVLKQIFDRNSALGFFNAMMGGSMSNFSIILMGLSPYINASIMIQLLTVVVPKLESLSKEGEQGRKVINRYTRWLALPIAFVQSYGMVLLLNNMGGGTPVIQGANNPLVILPIMVTVTTGTIFLMWLGEMITEKGIGNGISIIIFAGIVSSIPSSIGQTLALATANEDKFLSLIILMIVTIALIVFIIWFTEGQRNIPVTYAGRGFKVKNANSNIPIRVNQAGMIPIIFAVSLLTFPSIIANLFQQSNVAMVQQISEFILKYFNPQNPTWYYVIAYFILTILFAFFYVSVTFKPDNVAENIQKRGGFVPGIRPGKETAKYLGKISVRITLWGGLFLSLVAISPYIFNFMVSEITGTGTIPLLMTGAGLIIVVGVVLEIVRNINTELVMHDYDKFY